MGIEHLNTMVVGRRYKGIIIDHDKHSSFISYMYMCEEREDYGDNYYVIATTVGFLRVYKDKDSSWSRLSKEWQHHSYDEDYRYTIVVYDEREGEDR